MSTEEERAHLLRTIAVGGFSPYAEDCDGSTANTLLQWAEELAPMFAPPPPKRTPVVDCHLLQVRAEFCEKLPATMRASSFTCATS